MDQGMTKHSRRAVMLGAVAASLAATRLTTAQDDGPEPAAFGDGVAGGGIFELSTGEAEFSLVAFAQQQNGGPASFVGTFSLSDPSNPGDPLVMTTDFLSGYSAPNADRPDLRRVLGWARANGSGPFPFLLDVEIPAAGQDGETTLTVLFGEAAAILMGSGGESACDCGGFDYRVKGTVVSGGLTFFTIP